MSVLGAWLYQGAGKCCCERPHSASVNFFWRPLQHICSFHGGWFTRTDAHTVLSVQQFLTKNGMIHLPHSPYSPDLAPNNLFLLPRNKKSLQREMLCYCGRDKTKNDRNIKRQQNWWVQKLFWVVEKTSRKVYCIKSRLLWRWLKFKHVRINTQFFISKFRGYLGPLSCGRLIFDKDAKNTQWKKIVSPINGVGKIGYSHAKEWNWTP